MHLATLIRLTGDGGRGFPRFHAATAIREGRTQPGFERSALAAAGNLEPKEVPPEKVIFEIGSITKVFTSLLLAQAVTEQKAKLETKISEVLGPEMKYEDARVGAITLKQLATHTSGLPRLPANLAEGSDPNDPYASYDEKRLEAGLAGARLEGSARLQATYSGDQFQPRTHRLLCVVLMGLGIPKVHENPIPHVLRDEAAEALYGPCDALLIGGNDLAEVFRVHAGRESR